MPTANVYIDGFNLFYRCLKGTPYKWLDVLRTNADAVRPIQKGALAASQFPATLTDATGTFSKPPTW